MVCVLETRSASWSMAVTQKNILQDSSCGVGISVCGIKPPAVNPSLIPSPDKLFFFITSQHCIVIPPMLSICCLSHAAWGLCWPNQHQPQSTCLYTKQPYVLAALIMQWPDTVWKTNTASSHCALKLSGFQTREQFILTAVTKRDILSW